MRYQVEPMKTRSNKLDLLLFSSFSRRIEGKRRWNLVWNEQSNHRCLSHFTEIRWNRIPAYFCLRSRLIRRFYRSKRITSPSPINVHMALRERTNGRSKQAKKVEGRWASAYSAGHGAQSPRRPFSLKGLLCQRRIRLPTSSLAGGADPIGFPATWFISEICWILTKKWIRCEASILSNGRLAIQLMNWAKLSSQLFLFFACSHRRLHSIDRIGAVFFWRWKVTTVKENEIQRRPFGSNWFHCPSSAIWLAPVRNKKRSIAKALIFSSMKSNGTELRSIFSRSVFKRSVCCVQWQLGHPLMPWIRNISSRPRDLCCGLAVVAPSISFIQSFYVGACDVFAEFCWISSRNADR